MSPFPIQLNDDEQLRATLRPCRRWFAPLIDDRETLGAVSERAVGSIPKSQSRIRSQVSGHIAVVAARASAMVPAEFVWKWQRPRRADRSYLVGEDLRRG